MKNFFGSIFINRDDLREAGIEYPIKVEYYKITNEIPSRQKLIFGIQVIKTEYKEKIGVEQRKIDGILKEAIKAYDKWIQNPKTKERNINMKSTRTSPRIRFLKVICSNFF